MDAGAALLDERRGFHVVEGVAVVLLHARGDGEDVGVEDDVGGGEVRLLGEELVGALADLDLALRGVGLARLVESHDDGARAEAPDRACLLEEVSLAFLEGDRIHDALALGGAQAGL